MVRPLGREVARRRRGPGQERATGGTDRAYAQGRAVARDPFSFETTPGLDGSAGGRAAVDRKVRPRAGVVRDVGPGAGQAVVGIRRSPRGDR